MENETRTCRHTRLCEQNSFPCFSPDFVPGFICNITNFEGNHLIFTSSIPGSHPGNMGSTPIGDATFSRIYSLEFIFLLRNVEKVRSRA